MDLMITDMSSFLVISIPIIAAVLILFECAEKEIVTSLYKLIFCYCFKDLLPYHLTNKYSFKFVMLQTRVIASS